MSLLVHSNEKRMTKINPIRSCTVPFVLRWKHPAFVSGVGDYLFNFVDLESALRLMWPYVRAACPFRVTTSDKIEAVPHNNCPFLFVNM